MDAKENIIIQLKDIWLKLKLDKENLASRSNSKSLPDEDKQDIKESIESAQDVYDAHLSLFLLAFEFIFTHKSAKTCRHKFKC